MLLLGTLGFAQAPAGADASPSRSAAPVAPQLRVLLPDTRVPARRALTIVDRIVSVHGDRLDVVLVWPTAGVLARCGRRGPPGARDLVDADGRLRGMLAPSAAPDTALAAWSDGAGELALVEPLDDGAIHDAADAAAGAQLRDVVERKVDAVRRASSVSALRAVVDGAALELADRPTHLALVLDAALSCAPAIAADPGVGETVDQLFRTSPRSEAVQRLTFVARDSAGDVGGARQAGFAWVESVKARRFAARELADAVRSRNDDRAYDEVLALAFDVALAAAPDDESLARIVFEHRVDRQVDRIGAERAGRAYVAAVGADAATLNTFSWKLMTESPYAGEFDALALDAARAMAEDPAWRTYWRIDTYALACFRNGQFGEAVALQREAMDNADPSSRARYRQRLDEYTAAAAMPGAPPVSR